MGLLDRAINKGVQKAFDDFCAPGGGLDAAIKRVTWEHLEKTLSRTNALNRLGFTWALRLCFRRHGSTYADASRLANDTLARYLADEKIEFGDPNYGWMRGCADELADEYELRHWEVA